MAVDLANLGTVTFGSNFEVAGPFTEVVLLGNLALRTEGLLMWDGPNMRVTNNEAANQYIQREYRQGWTR